MTTSAKWRMYVEGFIALNVGAVASVIQTLGLIILPDVQKQLFSERNHLASCLFEVEI